MVLNYHTIQSYYIYLNNEIKQLADIAIKKTVVMRADTILNTTIECLEVSK